MADLSSSGFKIDSRDDLFSNNSSGTRYLEQENFQLEGVFTDANSNTYTATISLHSNGSGNVNPPVEAVRLGYGDSSSETYTVTITKN